MLSSIIVLQVFSQHQIKSTLLPAACKNPCLFSAVLLIAATSMDGMRVKAEPDPAVLALRQETLSLVRQQLASPETSGGAEHIMAIQCLAGASFVSKNTTGNASLAQLTSKQAYGFEPDLNFTIHMNALSTLLRARGKSKYKKTGIGRMVLNVLVMSVTLKA